MVFGDTNRKYMDTPVVSYALPPWRTCLQACPGCYARKGFYLLPSVRKKMEANFNFLSTASTTTIVDVLTREIQYWIPRGKRFFRLHHAGDFFNQQYVSAIAETFIANPNVVGFAYTKRRDLEFGKLESLPNFVLIRSNLYGPVNYFVLDEAIEFARRTGAHLCQCHLGIRCGIECRYCMTKTAEQQGVVFVAH